MGKAEIQEVSRASSVAYLSSASLCDLGVLCVLIFRDVPIFLQESAEVTEKIIKGINAKIAVSQRAAKNRETNSWRILASLAFQKLASLSGLFSVCSVVSGR
jgi:hypothetical protein